MASLRLGIVALAALVACTTRPVEQDAGTGSTTSGGDTSASGPDGTGPSSMTATPNTGMSTTAGPTTSMSTTTAETFDEDSGPCFVCPSDVGPQPRSCSVVDQDCPAGSKCVWYVPPSGGRRRDAARCITVDGDGAPFDPCTLPTGIGPEITDDCGAESFCLEVYGTADHGFCAPFALDYSCDAYPGTDTAFENGSDFPAACLYHECQPLLDTCPAGTQCTFYPAYLYGSMFCWSVPPGTDLPLGTPCDFGQCGEDKLCTPAEWLPDCAGERCCAEFCDLDAPSCATEGTSCDLFPVNYQDEPGFETLGACLLPGTFE